MARVSIFYDEDLKEQFFMVRGDERYARATKTILEVGASTPNLYDFDLSVTVNVLRDEGDGTIVIYDNNDPLFIIDDWNSSDNARTIVLEHMAYDIDHILTAEYRGNNKCSPSLSNATTVNIHDTNRATSTLTISSGTQYAPNHETTKTITLTNSASVASYNEGQELDIYYDDTYLTTVTTSEQGTATFTINTGNTELHSIKVQYVGSEHLTAETITQEISVGYKLDILSYPKVQIHTEPYYEYLARITDFFDNPTEYEVEASLYTVFDEEDEGIQVGHSTFPDEEGNLRFIGYAGSPYIELRARVAPDWYTVIYKSSLKPVLHYNPSRLEISTSSPQLYNSEETILTIKTYGTGYNNTEPLSNIPIQLSGAVNETIYTDDGGVILGNDWIATKSIVGTGKSTKTITATIKQGMTQTITLYDYLQYWQPNNNHNRKYFSNGITFMDLNNLYRISTSNIFVFTLPMTDNKNYEFIIEGLSSTKNAYVGFVPNTIGNENGITINDFVPPSTFVAHSNETWRMVRENGTVTTYKNDTVVNTYSNQGTYHPAFIYVANGTATNFDFTKLTIREL
jgi:hypothetical protein